MKTPAPKQVGQSMERPGGTRTSSKKPGGKRAVHFKSHKKRKGSAESIDPLKTSSESEGSGDEKPQAKLLSAFEKRQSVYMK